MLLQPPPLRQQTGRALFIAGDAHQFSVTNLSSNCLRLDLGATIRIEDGRPQRPFITQQNHVLHLTT